MTNQNAALSHMLTGQIMTGDVNQQDVLDALAKVARESFVPENFRGTAYIDAVIPLGAGRYCLEPLILARMLKYASVQKNETVLIVGAATGYSAAVVAGLAQKVVALEEDKALLAQAQKSLTAYGNVQAVEGELIKGAKAGSPYDVILIEGAIRFLPQSLIDVTREGGRIIAVEQIESPRPGSFGLGKLIIYKKIGGEAFKTFLHDASAPLLPGFKKPAGFVF